MPEPPLLLPGQAIAVGPQAPTCVVAVVVRVTEARVRLVRGAAGGMGAQLGSGVRVALACFRTLPAARLVLVIRMVLLVLDPQPLRLVHEGALLALAQQAAAPRAEVGWRGHPRRPGEGLPPHTHTHRGARVRSRTSAGTRRAPPSLRTSGEGQSNVLEQNPKPSIPIIFLLPFALSLCKSPPFGAF